MRSNNRNVSRFSSAALAILAVAAVQMQEACADNGAPSIPRIIEQVADGGGFSTQPRVVEQLADGGGFSTQPRTMIV